METIILHPKTKEESSLYEQLAKSLNTPYEIVNDKVDVIDDEKKPSDYFGTLSRGEAEEMLLHINQSRNEWERNI